jgi:hypothetical protein
LRQRNGMNDACPRVWSSFFSGSKTGALAQLGERLICIQEVRSSILLGSTKLQFVEQIGSKVGSVAQVVRAHA